jgi:hypothetical protein
LKLKTNAFGWKMLGFVHPYKSCSRSKGRWLTKGYFCQLAHYSLDMKCAVSTRWLGNPNRGRNHFPHSFWSMYEDLIH